MPTAIDTLGPLWPKLDPVSRETAIELANGMAADIELFDRDPADREAAIRRSMQAIGTVCLEPASGIAGDREAEILSATVRRLIEAILDGTAPPEVDRPTWREHRKVVSLVVAIMRGPEYRDTPRDELPEAVREVATMLHGRVEPPFDLGAVIRDAGEMVLDDSGESD